MSPSLLSKELLEVARQRLNGGLHSEANLRRATSDLYYAMFHAICEALVEPFGAVPDSPAYREAMRSLYRTVEHGHAERQCKKIIEEDLMPPAMLTFAKHFVGLRTKREEADYDPLQTWAVAKVRRNLEVTETRLSDFWTANPTERAAFAFMVGLRRGK